jgi:glycopeptide antibiotics resistance protein
LLVLYALLLMWLLFGQRIGAQQVSVRYNLQPLDTIRRYLWVLRHSSDAIQRQHAIVNLLGNVVLFVPLGILLPSLFSKLEHIFHFFLLTLLVIVLLEFLQLLTGLGALDVDDLFLNMVGTNAGFLLWRWFCR